MFLDTDCMTDDDGDEQLVEKLLPLEKDNIQPNQMDTVLDLSSIDTSKILILSEITNTSAEEDMLHSKNPKICTSSPIKSILITSSAKNFAKLFGNDFSIKRYDKARHELKSGKETKQLVSQYQNLCNIMKHKLIRKAEELDHEFTLWEKEYFKENLKSAQLEAINKDQKIRNIFEKKSTSQNIVEVDETEEIILRLKK